MSQENVEIVRRLWADLEAENVEASIHLLDEEVELWNAPEFPSRAHIAGTMGCANGQQNNGRSSAVFTMR
jgi:hypothetical protein